MTCRNFVPLCAISAPSFYIIAQIHLSQLACATNWVFLRRGTLLETLVHFEFLTKIPALGRRQFFVTCRNFVPLCAISAPSFYIIAQIHLSQLACATNWVFLRRGTLLETLVHFEFLTKIPALGRRQFFVTCKLLFARSARSYYSKKPYINRNCPHSMPQLSNDDIFFYEG